MAVLQIVGGMGRTKTFFHYRCATATHMRVQTRIIDSQFIAETISQLIYIYIYMYPVHKRRERTHPNIWPSHNLTRPNTPPPSSSYHQSAPHTQQLGIVPLFHALPCALAANSMRFLSRTTRTVNLATSQMPPPPPPIIIPCPL